MMTETIDPVRNATLLGYRRRMTIGGRDVDRMPGPSEKERG